MCADKIIFPEFRTFTIPNIKQQPISIVSRAVQKARYEIMAEEEERIFAALDTLNKRRYSICG